MAYGPHTPEDRAAMLAAIGVASVDELFADIPPSLRASGLKLPPPEAELDLAAGLRALAARNRVDLASFLGAGAVPSYLTVPLIAPPAALARPAPAVMPSVTHAHAANTTANFFITISPAKSLKCFTQLNQTL